MPKLNFKAIASNLPIPIPYNDNVITRDRTQVALSSLLEQYNSQIVFQEDLLDITFVERT